jgi:hypothetical protein
MSGMPDPTTPTTLAPETDPGTQKVQANSARFAEEPPYQTNIRAGKFDISRV